MIVRKLQVGDEELLGQFLDCYVESSMFLRSNLHAVGLVYNNQPYEGEYWAVFSDDGRVSAVLAHYWNGNLIVQAPDASELRALLKEFRLSVGRLIRGVLGEPDQVDIVLSGLGLADCSFALNCIEGLYLFELESLTLPDSKVSSYEMCQISGEHLSLLLQWIKDYEIEGLGKDDNADLDRYVADRVDIMLSGSNYWLLMVDGQPVSFSGFNARLPDIAQIGPVWTPVSYRRRGYARLLVALTLQHVRNQGVQKAILFTNNPFAIKAYEAIGFDLFSSYRLSFLKEPVSLSA